MATFSSTNEKGLDYPDSDGEPMSDNTLQFQWIVTLQGGFDALFRDDPDTFVAGDLLWYPVEGDNKIRMAPDVLIVLGRPKGRRGSYIQHRENGVAPTVVMEVLSPGNTPAEMARKFQFYDQYGVSEYYIYDPDHGELHGYVRNDLDRLVPVAKMRGHRSPNLGVIFDLEDEDLVVTRPDGERFLSYLELDNRLEIERERAELERERAEAEFDRAELERKRAEKERQRAIQAEAERDRLLALLRFAGIDPGQRPE